MEFTNRGARPPHHRPPRPGQPTASHAAHTAAPAKTKPSDNLVKRWWRRALAVLVVLALVGLLYGYINTKNQLEAARQPGSSSGTEAQQLQDKVGKLVQLPEGQTPTIATVNNASKLKNQAFFANAQNGDKVLIYSKSGQAVLYRPSTNRVIEFSNVNLTNSSSSSSTTGQ